MKNFLKYTLATITGLILVGLLSIIILGGIFSAMVASTKKQVVIKENSMLQLKLDEAILDRAPNDPFQDLEIPGFSQTKKTGLDAIIQAIEKSKDEDNIKGIFLRLTNINAGYSACEEIRNALVDFKTSGKFIYAYSETYTQKAYFLATVADKVFINPEGMLMFSGISADAMFFKNALDKLGVEMQVIRHGKFKAAVEPFMLDKMSPENREQVESYNGSICSNVWQKFQHQGVSRSAGLTKLPIKTCCSAPQKMYWPMDWSTVLLYKTSFSTCSVLKQVRNQRRIPVPLFLTEICTDKTKTKGWRKNSR
jgi:protease-4